MSEPRFGLLRKSRKFSWLVCVVVTAPLVLTGCSSMNDNSENKGNAEAKLGYKPEVRAVEDAKQEVNAISSNLLDWMGVEGKVTESGAAVSVCEAIDPDLTKYYTIHHPWSVYKLSKGTFETAMRNVRERLPKHGWEITQEGETKSRARNPEIVAVNRRTHHWVQIEWAKERSGDLEELISVDVDSRCYRAPKGAEL
ncbi:hypothetical protein ACFY8S_39980 [Streptomyces hygroscopicus]|uniref:hypothetical protein n=1 Tax=Streptomyces hygroscopicus TaxID=1912 RepID=UPI0036860FDA